MSPIYYVKKYSALARYYQSAVRAMTQVSGEAQNMTLAMPKPLN